jgi:hypothetical protein
MSGARPGGCAKRLPAILVRGDSRRFWGGTNGRPMPCATRASAGSFAFGAAQPLFVTALAPQGKLFIFVPGTSLVFLALLGALAARAGGARMSAGGDARRFLGRSGDGGNRRHRCVARHSSLSGPFPAIAQSPRMRRLPDTLENVAPGQSGSVHQLGVWRAPLAEVPLSATGSLAKA